MEIVTLQSGLTMTADLIAGITDEVTVSSVLVKGLSNTSTLNIEVRLISTLGIEEVQ